MRRFLLLLSCMAAITCTQAQQENGLPDVITIPVVVHVLYNDARENISDAQIFSQLDVLNQDYRGTNADRSKTPAYFASLAADCGFMFRLAKTSPDGSATTGIVRKYTTIQYFGTDDRAKSSAGGGDNAWNSRYYLNIWVCNLAGGIMGYTSKMGGAAEKDGVVIQYTAFGTTGTATAPFNLGRTATHEIGHWLNLLHIWGDAYCGDDQVDDTPQQRSSNRGQPTGEHFSCGTSAHGDMYMNYMDLTDDAAMHLFTKGQRQRMRALFGSGGARAAILSSPALQEPLAANISTSAKSVSSLSPVAVYPNPAAAVITVNLDAGAVVAGQVLTIYNSAGQPVLTQAFSSAHITVSLSHLPAGIYYLKANITLVKFVKL